MHIKLTAISSVAFACAFAAQAHAQAIVQEKPEVGPPDVPIKALEIVGGTGYTQGFGSLQQGVDMQNVITRGLALELAIGYRIDPHWLVSLDSQYQEFDSQRTATARGMTGGVGVAYHILPFDRWDPWVRLGTGYRLIWESAAVPDQTPTLLTHGFEPVRLTLGLDYRTSRDLAISPMIGIDLTVPVWQSVGGAASVAIANPQPSTFVFAGIGARFDVTGTYVRRAVPQPVATTQTTAAQVTPPAPAPPPVTPVSPSLSASDEVLAACKINLDNIDTAPKFDFDKADLVPADVDMLNKIAECFATGPLKDQGVLLVGRADPRGSVEYNQALGMRRAESVAKFLEQHGVDHGRIERTSRGKLDATGTDEASWAKDRRVDVLRVEIRLSRR
jgi:peptidoglycan-associated lipoprotein